jgi:hypothetical protein
VIFSSRDAAEGCTKGVIKLMSRGSVSQRYRAVAAIFGPHRMEGVPLVLGFLLFVMSTRTDCKFDGSTRNTRSELNGKFFSYGNF